MRKISDFLTRQQIADELGVHPNTLLYWERAGRISPKRNPMNNYRMYDKEEVIKLLNLDTKHEPSKE